MSNIKVKSIGEYNVYGLNFPLVTLYYSPTDYPGKYVARIFDAIPSPTPTDGVMIYNTEEEARADIWNAGYRTFFPRAERDKKCIIGTFMR